MSDDLQHLRNKAYEHFAAGDFNESLACLATLHARQGSNPELANDIAVVLHKLGRTQEALLKFREAQNLSGEARSLVADNLIDILEVQLQAFSQQSEEHRKQLAARSASLTGAYDDFAGKVLRQALTLWQSDSAGELHRSLKSLDDEVWAEVLCESVDGKLFEGHILPGFIAEETQRTFVGSSGVPALREAQNFIRVVLHYARENGISFDGRTRAVDFGSGWGRYTRFMLKYVHPDNLYGLEVNSAMVEHCRKSFGMANFIKVESYPPCDLRDNLVDLVFGYSVFSHLAPACANAWIEEFARIMRPGGLLLMTTQGRTFIDYCRNIRESGNRSHPWFVSLAKAFADTEQAYRDYDAGEFLHYGEGQYGGSYGESLIPRGYVEKAWLKDFELVDYVDDRAFLPQALFVLRRC
ncbi:methyltransferase domain-containing protein [Aquipseudomonas alcaligenes]|uniref:methyltransferase domain-containing protein n=1 Tax=Aquipseudomonas alcaligenes TaxID=43263 RepID=UPI0036631CE5